MNPDQMNDLQKRLDDYLSESLQSETPEKRDLFRALAPMAIQGLYPIVFQGGSAGVSAARLIFEVVGLIGKGQKSTATSKDPAA
jgi:hypothetical protein